MIRVGIIGCGNIAGLNELDPYREKPCTHIGAYRTREDVEIIGCCDLNLSLAESFAMQFEIDFFTDSWQQLLRNKIDVLSICIPYPMHHQMVTAIASAPLAPQTLFLEKPIANSFDKAEEIVSLCEENSINLYVNNRRLSSFYKLLKALVISKLNNKILSITAWSSSGMHAVGVHMVDLLRCLAGEVEWVFAAQETAQVDSLPFSHNFTPDDPRFTSMLGFKNGVQAAFFNTAQTEFTFFEIDIVGKNGRIRASGNGKKITVQEKTTPGTSTLSYSLTEEEEFEYESVPLFKSLIDEVLDGLHPNSPLKGKEALRTYQVIDAMKRSSAKKKIINLDEGLGMLY